MYMQSMLYYVFYRYMYFYIIYQIEVYVNVVPGSPEVRVPHLGVVRDQKFRASLFSASLNSHSIFSMHTAAKQGDCPLLCLLPATLCCSPIHSITSCILYQITWVTEPVVVQLSQTYQRVNIWRLYLLPKLVWCWISNYFKCLPPPVVPSCHGDSSVLKKDKADNLAVIESTKPAINRIAVFFVVIIGATFKQNTVSRIKFHTYRGLLQAFSLGQKLKTRSSSSTQSGFIFATLSGEVGQLKQFAAQYQRAALRGNCKNRAEDVQNLQQLSRRQYLHRRSQQPH